MKLARESSRIQHRVETRNFPNPGNSTEESTIKIKGKAISQQIREGET